MREAWGAYPPNGAANMTAWMIGNGHALLTTINQACAAQGFAPGSGTMCAEIQARTMLNYTEVRTVTSHAMFSQWTGFLEVEDLIQAEVLITSGSDWAKLMSRVVTFAATSCSKNVPESEPERAKLNTWCLKFKDLQGARTMARAQALSVDENRNAFDLIVNGLGQYSEELKGLPTRAVTQILTPGAVKGKTDILALAEAYDLTPEQVETIMKALDFASPKIREVRKALREADRDSATVTLTTYQDTIKRSFTEDQGKNGPGVDAFNKPRGGYTGLQIPAGYFGGGIVPGTPPSDPTRDNIFAMGANTGQPLMVRSGEWIINEQSSRENDRWLAMINQGLRLDDIIPGFAAGDRYDAFSELTASSALDLARQQQRIREINRSLKATESYGKGKNKRKRLVLKLGSQDRKVAELELKDAQDQLARMRNENKELRNYGTDAQESELRDRENAKQDAIDKAAEVAARQREAVASASGSITGGASLSGISSAAGLERRLNQVVADSAAFTQVIDALTRAGASQLVLDILKKEGPSKASIRVGRQLLADTARLARVNVTSASLTSIGQAYGDLTAGVGTLTSAQSTTLLQITTTDISQLSGEIARQVDHRLSTQATGAGV